MPTRTTDQKKVKIETADLADWPAIKAIYLEGIATGHATFVTACGIPEGAEWFSKKISKSILKAIDVDGEVLAWGALQAISGACSYAGVAEVSVYVSASARGQGLGSQILQELIAFAECNDIWTLQASIFPENEGSLRLHEKHKFVKVGRRQAIGKLNGTWRDEYLLERRSTVLY
ncbi:MAG: GNAT family N-acetyltransferase [Saprospiraceae bacterium]|nr:GNAT family N-acetyltransferase [Saprospiraceae bacterium]